MTIDIRGRRRLGRRELYAATHWLVFHRGVEVTNDVFYLDGRRKVARVYHRNSLGLFHLDRETLEPVTETLYHVQISRS